VRRATVGIPDWLYKALVFVVLLWRWVRYGYSFRKIPLTQGQVAIVDADDYARLSKNKWYAGGRRYAYYAVRDYVCKRTKERVTVHMHRVILPVSAGLVVEHINGNGIDNRKANLRPATPAQNSRNRRRLAKNKTSRYRGVCRSKGRRLWLAVIIYNGRQIRHGSFADERDAAFAYDAAAKKYHKEFAVLNFPD